MLVAALACAAPRAVVFTSGATESNNLALFGVARFHRDRGRHIVSSRTEHKAVLDTLKQLEAEGFEVTYLDPDTSGLISPAAVEAALRPDTILVSVMLVNNEIGVIQPIDDLMAAFEADPGAVSWAGGSAGASSGNRRRSRARFRPSPSGSCTPASLPPRQAIPHAPIAVSKREMPASIMATILARPRLCVPRENAGS